MGHHQALARNFPLQILYVILLELVHWNLLKRSSLVVALMDLLVSSDASGACLVENKIVDTIVE
jgi:hypothetical protein